MRPTFLGFESGRKGLVVAQKGLDVTGQNMSNMSTPGYTRQRIDQVSLSAYGYTSRFAGSRVDFAGQGVSITGISQTRNAYLDRRFREEFSGNFYYQQKVDILGDISAVVDQYSDSGGGLTLSVQELTKALQGLTSDKATDRTSISLLRTAFQGTVQTLHDYSTKLDKVAEQQKYDLSISVNDVNNTLSKIAGLNEQIFNEIALNTGDSSVYGPNELLDKRNLLLDELARYGDVGMTQAADGTVTVQMGGYDVVKGGRADRLNVVEQESGAVTLHWNSDASEMKINSGALKASIEMINGRGPDVQSRFESSSKGVPYYKDQMNTFARTLAKMVNEVLPNELDDEGNAVVGKGYKQLLGAATVDKDGKPIVSQNVEVTAANISITDDWSNEVTYAFPSDTSKANADFFHKMNALLSTDATTRFETRGQVFIGTFGDFIDDIHNNCVGDENYTQGRLDASGAVADDLLNQRDSVSAVSKDEETANMMMYQKSFQAVSRIMTTMDEMLDVIINQMGLVGR